jgi:hypothetical protein
MCESYAYERTVHLKKLRVNGATSLKWQLRIYSLSLCGISWSGSHAFEISLCGLHSEGHMDMNEVPPNQDLNPLLLQIKNNSEWTIREWFMALIDSYRKQWVIVHLLNCNFHQQVPSTYLFITCLPTHSQTLREPNWIFGHYYWCAKSTWEEVQANPTKHYTTAANPQIVITFLLSAPRVQA